MFFRSCSFCSPLSLVHACYPASLHSLQSHVRALDQIRIDRVSLQRAFALESQEDMRSQTKKHNAKEGTREPQKTTQQHNNHCKRVQPSETGPRTANKQHFEADWHNTFNSDGNTSVRVQFYVRNSCRPYRALPTPPGVSKSESHILHSAIVRDATCQTGCVFILLYFMFCVACEQTVCGLRDGVISHD